MGTVAPVGEIQRVNDVALRVALGFPDAHQLMGLGERQRTQQDGIHDAEDSGIRADSQRQREYRDDAECRAATQQARSVAQILRELFGRVPTGHFVYDLLHRGDIAEGAPRGVRVRQFFGFQVEMRA